MTTLPRRGPGGVILSGAGVVEQDAGNAALPMAAASRAFQTTTEAIGNVAETRQKMSYYEGIIREGVAEAEARRLAAEFDIALDRERFGAVGGANPVPADKMSAFGAERGKALFDETIGRASDELVRNRLQPRLEQTQAKWQLQIDSDARNRLVDKAKADIIETGRLFANQYHSAPSPAARATTVKALDDMLAAATRTGIMTAEGAAVFRAKWLDDAQTSAVVGIARTDPRAARAALAGGEFPDIDPAGKERLLASLDVDERQQAARIEAEQRERETEADQAWRERWFDVDEALQNGDTLTLAEIDERAAKDPPSAKNLAGFRRIRAAVARQGARRDDASKEIAQTDALIAQNFAPATKEKLDKWYAARGQRTAEQVLDDGVKLAWQIRQVPTQVTRVADGLLYNSDPNVRIMAASAISKMGDASGVGKESRSIAYAINSMAANGVPPATISTRIDQMLAAGEAPGRESRINTGFGEKGGMLAIAQQAVAELFGNEMLGTNAGPEAVDYWKETFRNAYMVHGIRNLAAQEATDAVSRGYGKSKLAMGGFTQAPPETMFAIYGDQDTDAEWIGDQLNERYNVRGDAGLMNLSSVPPWRHRLRLMVDPVTLSDIRAGNPPRYLVVKQDPDTPQKYMLAVDTAAPQGMAYFTPDRNKELARIADQQKAEGAERVRKAEEERKRIAAPESRSEFGDIGNEDELKRFAEEQKKRDKEEQRRLDAQREEGKRILKTIFPPTGDAAR